MKAPKPQNIETAVDRIETFVKTQPQYPYFRSHRNRYKNDLRILTEFYSEGKILDIGSFPYHFTALLKILDFQIFGIDLLPSRNQAMIDEFELMIQRCDIEKEPLPFPDKTFSYILFNEVFEHLRYDPFYVLSQLNRVLTPDGLLVLSTPNLYALQRIARFLSGHGFSDPIREFNKLRNVGHMGHIREYSHREIRKFLKATNFTVEHVWYQHYYYPMTVKGAAAYLLFHLLPSRFRSYQVVLSRKSGPHVPLRPL